MSSDATDERHRVAPFELAMAPEAAWEAARAAIHDLPRLTPVEETDRYLHVTSRSPVFGFVDDLELELRPEDGTIAVRSASRVGVSDLGVNRRRVEALRAALVERGIVR